MKKLLWVAILFLAFSSVSAQTKVKYGLGAGINISNIVDDNGNGTSYSPSSKVGFRGYAFADIWLNKNFSIESDLGYDGMGFKINDASFGTATASINYFTVSILPKIHIKQSGVAFFIGPALGFLLSSNVSANGITQDFDAYNSVEFFGVFGMEYISPMGLGLNFRFMPGFTNIAKNPDPGETVHNANFAISAVYQFK